MTSVALDDAARTVSRSSPHHSALVAAAPAEQADLGTLPEWDLSDLYPGIGSPAFVDSLMKRWLR